MYEIMIKNYKIKVKPVFSPDPFGTAPGCVTVKLPVSSCRPRTSRPRRKKTRPKTKERPLHDNSVGDISKIMFTLLFTFDQLT